jgi:hypothetical protein
MNVFKMIFPDYWVQETSKIVKFFVISKDSAEADTDWKEYFLRRFKDQAQSVYLVTGAEALASDYKLLKNPIMAPYLQLKAVVVEFSSNAEGLNCLI